MIWARSNNSLDASGVSGLLIYNLSVAQSSAAASTQPLDRHVVLLTRMNLLRVLMVGLFFLIGSGGWACKYSQTHSNLAKAAQSPLPTPSDADPDLKTGSEIELRRINSGCINCDDHSLVLRRRADDIFADASVIRTDLHTQKQRTGTLSAYYYNHLIQLVRSQGIFDMDDQYAMGWLDSLVVTLNVSVGDRRKTIRTSSEGEVPLKLWGFYMAIDGTVARTKWNDAK